MNYHIASKRPRRADRSVGLRATGTTRAVAVGRSAVSGPSARPLVSARQVAQSVLGWIFSLIFLGNGGLITALWIRGGGITSVNSVGAALTSAGRITGLLGAYLLLVQILLLARLPFLEFVAGFDRLARWHRLNGKISLYLILAHVGLITAGYALTDRLSIPAEARSLLVNYPGMIKALIGTVLLILVAVTSIVIVRRRLRYEAWFLVHLLAYVGIFLAWFHQVPTGNEFVVNPMAAAYWTALYVVTLQLVLLFRFGQPLIRSAWHRMRVAEIVEEGAGVVSIRITGRHLQSLNAQAGQFFLWRFLARGRWWESHPFSLSAAPDGESLRITIKNLGDFSRTIGQLKLGTFVIAEGPFGTFTEKSRRRDRIALIAGGVGITPIRALLEEMAGNLVLVYRAVRAEELIFRGELDELARERGITIHYVLGDHRTPGNEHLMSAEHLRQLIPDIAGREIFLCGPPIMMRVLETNIRHAGVPSRYIHTDEFAF